MTTRASETTELLRADFDLQLPFTVQLSGPDVDADELECLRLERLVPGRRLVCFGTWRGQEVYAKIFIDPRQARRNWRRERRGIELLHSRGILAPELLYAGPSKDHRALILILKAVRPAMTLGQAMDQTGSAEERVRLLRAILHVFAVQHNAGIVHEDPHFNNFLISSNGVYTLDASDVRDCGRSLSRRASLRNLTKFLAIFNPSFEIIDDLSRLFPDYVAMRGSHVRSEDLPLLIRNIVRVRKHNAREYLATKIFRECTAFIRVRTLRSRIVYDRNLDSHALRSFFGDLDGYVDNRAEKYLKRGNSSTVAVVTVAGQRMVIKRYNIKSPWHGVKRALRKTRAARSWANAHRLILSGVNTAKPIALVEKRLGPLAMTSYTVTEHVDGRLCSDYFVSDDISDDQKQAMADRIIKLFSLLSRAHIAHGDMKATNIVVSNDNPVVLDLDSMREIRLTCVYRRHFAKDVKRFMQNWEDKPGVYSMFASRLKKVNAKIW